MSFGHYCQTWTDGQVRTTGYVLGAAAGLGIVTTLFAFPSFYARLGTTRSLLACQSAMSSTELGIDYNS